MFEFEGRHLKCFIMTLIFLVAIAMPSFAIESDSFDQVDASSVTTSVATSVATSVVAADTSSKTSPNKKIENQKTSNSSEKNSNNTKATDSKKASTDAGNNAKVVAPEPPPLEPPSNNGIMGKIQPLIQQYGLYGGIGIGVIVVLFIVIKVIGGGKKNQSACVKCGASVLPGMNYCSSCSNKNIISDMEGMAGEVPVYTPEPSMSASSEIKKHDLKKKIRPSGRVIATITIRKGANAGYKFSFYDSQTQLSIGKAPECDLVLEDDDDKDISQRHAVISMADGSIFTIHDMSNSVGILVNSERVKKSSLKSGDVIKISKTELTFARL